MIIKHAHTDIKHKSLPNGQPATTQLYLSYVETEVPNLQEVSVLHILEKGSIDGQGQENHETTLFILSGVGILHCNHTTYPYEPRDFFMVDPGREPFMIENTGDEVVFILIIRMKIGRKKA